jgi:hypothetical protein
VLRIAWAALQEASSATKKRDDAPHAFQSKDGYVCAHVVESHDMIDVHHCAREAGSGRSRDEGGRLHGGEWNTSLDAGGKKCTTRLWR